MPDLTNLVETFSASFENLILALGRGVAEAQQELDQHSIQTQEALDSDPNWRVSACRPPGTSSPRSIWNSSWP